MRTTKAVSISLPPSDLKLAERLAKQTDRSLSGIFRQGLKRLQNERPRCSNDADIAASMQDFKHGHFHGLFDTAAEASRYIERVAKERRATKQRLAAKNARRPAG